jgi:hypothetical protein
VPRRRPPAAISISPGSTYDVASARIFTARFNDYLLLAKQDER